MQYREEHGDTTNVVRLGERDMYADLRRYEAYVQANHDLNRVWRKHLTDAEYSLLHFFIDGTIGWRSDRMQITHNKVGSGTPRYGCGTGKKRRTTIDLIKALVAKGFLRQVLPGEGEDDESFEIGGYVYILNYRWNESMLSVPKRLKNKGKPCAEKAKK